MHNHQFKENRNKSQTMKQWEVFFINVGYWVYVRFAIVFCWWYFLVYASTALAPELDAQCAKRAKFWTLDWSPNQYTRTLTHCHGPKSKGSHQMFGRSVVYGIFHERSPETSFHSFIHSVLLFVRFMGNKNARQKKSYSVFFRVLFHISHSA